MNVLIKVTYVVTSYLGYSWSVVKFPFKGAMCKNVEYLLTEMQCDIYNYFQWCIKNLLNKP